MAKDSTGQPVGFGDYVKVRDAALSPHVSFSGIARIVKISESPKGTRATGAFVDLFGNGRVTRFQFDPIESVLVLLANGTDAE